MGNPIGKLYFKLFSKPSFSRLNDKVLKYALKVRGYNNYLNSKESGEDFFISEILAPSNPKLCLDIGANVGNYSKMLLEKTNATVISFEPLPDAFEKLKQQTAKFGERAIVENKGVGDRVDTLTIHYDPAVLSLASFSEEVKQVSYVKNQMAVDVDVVTLDAYIESKPVSSIDFIKIDTEGYESEVLNGAMDTIRNHSPKFIQIEFNWHQLFRNTTLNYFAELLPEYDVFQLLPDNWVKRDPKDSLSNLYLFSNFVFVRR